MFYAGYCKYGVNCSFESMNGNAWEFYAFEKKSERDAFVEEQYPPTGMVVACPVTAKELRGHWRNFCVGERTSSGYYHVYPDELSREWWDSRLCF